PDTLSALEVDTGRIEIANGIQRLRPAMDHPPRRIHSHSCGGVERNVELSDRRLRSAQRQRSRSCVHGVRERLFPGLRRICVTGDVGGTRATVRATVHEDRKSTRLNSSHVKISYAVFCL